MAQQVLAILEPKNLPPSSRRAAAPKCRSSAAFRATAAIRSPVAGQVDRLAITGDTVLIADYKTDGAVPQRLDDVPPAYLAQLALYRAVIARIYPDKTVRAALIFTNGPVLLEMPAASMDRALKAELAKRPSRCGEGALTEI